MDTPECVAHDVSQLRIAELWQLVVGKQLGRRIADRIPDEKLRPLGAHNVAELTATYGVAPEKALRVAAVFELARRFGEERLLPGSPLRTSGDIFRHFHSRMRDLRVEQFRVILVDGKHRVIAEHLISQGTLTMSPVHPREVFSAAIRQGAAGMILVHNHPSGDASPSGDDLEITRRLVQVGDLVGIRVLDHVIVGDGAYASLADRGLL